MEYFRALKASLKYNLLALLPTVLGIGIIAATGWTGLVEPLITALELADPETILSGEILTDAAIQGKIVVAGVVIGYFIHRVGRTALLLRIYGEAVHASLDADQPERVPVPTPPVTSHDEDDATDSSDDEDDEGDGEDETDDDENTAESPDEQEDEDVDEVLSSIKDNLNMDDEPVDRDSST